MIYVFCGEDSTASRDAYQKYILKLKQNGYSIEAIGAARVPELLTGMGDALTLFSNKIAYISENIEKVPFRKSAKIKKDTYYESLTKIHKQKDLIVVTWEDEKPARNLKMKDAATVYESHHSQSIFTFLDSFIPNSKSDFIILLRKLIETQEEMFIFVMLQRHVKLLLLAKKNIYSTTTSPWQRSKLKAQAARWADKALEDIYEGIIRLEVGIKTSSNPYGISKSLEILACHYL